MDVVARGLNDGLVSGSFTHSQNFSILVAGLSCASLSLIASIITLRWFLVMKQLFRHRLVMYLIMSDTFKGVWYFVFSVVVIAGGPVKSSSKFCQASGFLLAVSIEASDVAVLVIAVHSVLYVTHPPVGSGSGGLYRFRKWIPLVWLLYPIVAASLAFVNKGHAYVTAGTYCYLPVRPFWYRLALAWIPRYLIFIAILAMYGGIYLYVHLKFRGFKNVMQPDSQYSSAAWHSYATEYAVDEKEGAVGSESPGSAPARTPVAARPQPRRLLSYESTTAATPQPSGPKPAPWETLNFITTAKPFNPSRVAGVESNDFANRGSASTDVTWVPLPDVAPPAAAAAAAGPSPTAPPPPPPPTIPPTQARDLEAPTAHVDLPGETNATGPMGTRTDHGARDLASQDPVSRTRRAIRQQLRFLFIYPAVYILLWILPFINHCFMYNDHYVRHPIFWLQLATYCCLSLQAGFDCVVFSWREKPWRRIDNHSRLSIPFWRQQSYGLVQRLGKSRSSLFGGAAGAASSRDHSTAGKSAAGAGASFAADGLAPLAKPSSARGPTWWEAEGKKRKDSVWLGTDLLTQIATRTTHRGPPSLVSQSGSRPDSRHTTESDARSASV